MIYGVGLTTYCVLVLLYRDSFNYVINNVINYLKAIYGTDLRP